MLCLKTSHSSINSSIISWICPFKIAPLVPPNSSLSSFSNSSMVTNISLVKTQYNKNLFHDLEQDGSSFKLQRWNTFKYSKKMSDLMDTYMTESYKWFKWTKLLVLKSYSHFHISWEFSSSPGNTYFSRAKRMILYFYILLILSQIPRSYLKSYLQLPFCSELPPLLRGGIRLLRKGDQSPLVRHLALRLWEAFRLIKGWEFSKHAVLILDEIQQILW